MVAHQVSAVGPLRTTQVIGRSRYSEPPERLRLGLEPERSADAVERRILPGRSVVAEAMFLSVVTRHRLPELNIRHFACSNRSAVSSWAQVARHALLDLS